MQEGPVAFNHNAKATVVRIGQRAIPITRIDDVLQDPHSTAALGRTQPYAPDPSNLYPGLRAAVPESFSSALRGWLTPILQHNGILEPAQSLHRDSTFYSVVTTASSDLLPIQRIPHYDSTDPKLLAAVLYLCAPPFSGTSFYRHRKTGYEAITRENQKNYQLALDHELRAHGPPPREYVNGDNARFERIHSNELRFNSAVIYPGSVLHAGNIETHFQPPADPSQWRLTVTSLLLRDR